MGLLLSFPGLDHNITIYYHPSSNQETLEIHFIPFFHTSYSIDFQTLLMDSTSEVSPKSSPFIPSTPALIQALHSCLHCVNGLLTSIIFLKTKTDYVTCLQENLCSFALICRIKSMFLVLAEQSHHNWCLSLHLQLHLCLLACQLLYPTGPSAWGVAHIPKHGILLPTC